MCILWTCCIFYVHLVYFWPFGIFLAIWYILWKMFMQTHPSITKAIRFFHTLFAQQVSTLNWVLFGYSLQLNWTNMYFYGYLVYFPPVLVCRSKKTLATLDPNWDVGLSCKIVSSDSPNFFCSLAKQACTTNSSRLFLVKVILEGDWQGCQSFLGPNIPKREKYTKGPQTTPNGHYCIKWPYVNYTKGPKNLPTFSIPRPSKINPNWYFWS
jgi:hypothetical protein